MTDTTKEPRSTNNMAAALRCTVTGTERTLAIAPGLTHDEAVTYTDKWRGKHEVLTGFVQFS
jgi:hypothetical protein